MVANISFNPAVTTNAAGSFNVQSTGYIQGTLVQNPVENFKIAGGLVGSTETVPMWGGLAITENVVPTVSTDNVARAGLGGNIIRATSISNVTGFTVFDQNYSMLTTPQSPVPLAPSGNSIHFVRLGSNVRVAVAADPSVAALDGTAINSNVSWDFTNGILQPYDPSTATIAASSTVTWASTNGGQLTFPVANWTGAFQPIAGDFMTISGATNSGTGGTAAINQGFFVVSASATQAILAAPAASGVFGTIGGSPVLNFGTGILPVKVLEVSVGTSMTVTYNPITGFANWNRSGTTAVILI